MQIGMMGSTHSAWMPVPRPHLSGAAPPARRRSKARILIDGRAGRLSAYTTVELIDHFNRSKEYGKDTLSGLIKSGVLVNLMGPARASDYILQAPM